MNTAQSLKEQFGSIHPKLVDVADYYLNLSEGEAKKQATKGLIPFPVFKASNSNKAAWIVDVRDLAEYLERERKKQ